MPRNVLETKVRLQFLSLILLVANNLSHISHSILFVLFFRRIRLFLNEVFEGVELQVARIIFFDDRPASFLPDVFVALAVVS